MGERMSDERLWEIEKERLERIKAREWAEEKGFANDDNNDEFCLRALKGSHWVLAS